MELFKQEMELFIPFPGIWSKNFFYNIFYILIKEFKIEFQNRKWNYFSYIQAFSKTTSFTKCFSFKPRSSKLIFKTGNGIIFPIYRPLIKKLLLQNISDLNQGFQNWFSKQKMELSKQEMDLFIPFPGLWSKNLSYKLFLTDSLTDWLTHF